MEAIKHTYMSVSTNKTYDNNLHYSRIYFQLDERVIAFV